MILILLYSSFLQFHSTKFKLHNINIYKVKIRKKRKRKFSKNFNFYILFFFIFFVNLENKFKYGFYL